MKVLLVDEYAVLRHSLGWFLGDEPGFEVCGGVGTVTDAIDARWDPNLIVHELLLPDCEGPEVARRLRSRFPDAGLLVLSRLDMLIYVRLAMNAGADGYVRKAADPRDVVDALVRIAEGQRYVEPELGATLARWEEPLRREDACSPSALTEREREVIELLALGHTNAEVGHTLGIAVRTVEAHRGHLMQKLGLHSRAELVRCVADLQHRI